MMGMGARVLLEFDTNLKIRSASRQGTGSTGYGLFPGMIAAFKGRNGSGDSFVVSEILRVRLLDLNDQTNLTCKVFRYHHFRRWRKQIAICR